MNTRSWIRMAALAMLVPLAIGLSSCAVTDLDHTVDFSKYKTFGWGRSEVEADNPVFESSLIEKRIKNTVESEFARKGLVYEKSNPDLLVSYRTYTEKKQKSYTPGYSYPMFMPFSPWVPMRAFYFGGFPYGWGYPYMPMQPLTYTVTEGTLVVDIIDADSGETIWRGSVTGDVANNKALARQIEKGVRAITKKYPV